MSGQVLVLTVFFDEFLLTLVSRTKEQFIQRTHYPELALAPSLAAFAIT